MPWLPGPWVWIHNSEWVLCTILVPLEQVGAQGQGVGGDLALLPQSASYYMELLAFASGIGQPQSTATTNVEEAEEEKRQPMFCYPYMKLVLNV